MNFGIGTNVVIVHVNSLNKKDPLLGCGSFVRGRKRKKGDSIPFILSRRDYPMRLHGECP